VRGLRHWLRPVSTSESIYEIDLSALRAQGIRGMILDLDNTIVPWGERQAPQELVRWIGDAHAMGLRLCIVSNNWGRRVDRLAAAIGLPCVPGALKPRRAAFRRALHLMGTTPESTVLIGDQLFTDILGGNRLGLYTILVHPQSRREFVLTRFVRFFERAVRGVLSGRR
jgi:uncharacterized protein